jgi:UDPglucose 6-dehydrogenase
VVEESQSLELARRLGEDGIRVVVHDPLAVETARTILGDKVAYAASMDDCAKAADVLVVATPCEEFRTLDPSSLRSGATVLDCWRLLPARQFAGRQGYILLGKGP